MRSATCYKLIARHMLALGRHVRFESQTACTDPFFNSRSKQLAAFALQQSIPVI